MSRISRRDTLRLLASGGVAAVVATHGRRARAFGGTGPVAILDLGQEDTRPRALESLIGQVRENTSSKVLENIGRVRPEDPELFAFPFIYAAGAERISPISEAGRQSLRLFLEQGGTMLIDDTSGRQDSPFATSTKAALTAVLPDRPWFPLDPDTHAIYRSFFHLHRTSGRVVVRPYIEGLNCGDITSVLISRNDLGGAWYFYDGQSDQRSGQGYG